jgi:hypothetical protein
MILSKTDHLLLGRVSALVSLLDPPLAEQARLACSQGKAQDDQNLFCQQIDVVLRAW